MAFISMLFAFGAIFFIVCLLMLVAGAACVVFCALLGIQYQESAHAAAAKWRYGEEDLEAGGFHLGRAVAAVLLGSAFLDECFHHDVCGSDAVRGEEQGRMAV